MPSESAGSWSLETTRHDGFPAVVWRDEGMAVPKTWTARCVGPDGAVVALSVEIEHGRAVCTAVTREAGPPLTAQMLRSLPLRRLIAHSARSVMSPVTEREDGGLDFHLFGGARPKAEQVAKRVMARNDDHPTLLRKVADRYRELTEGDRPDPAPRKVIAQEMGYSVGYVAQLLNEARSTRPPLLGPARRGMAGEQHQPRRRKDRP
jgi:hypothetical protein